MLIGVHVNNHYVKRTGTNDIWESNTNSKRKMCFGLCILFFFANVL